MSCPHGNPHDDCDLCEALDSVWRKYSELEAEKDARIAELTAEVVRLRGLVTQIHVLAADPIRPFEETNDEIERIARNALKEVSHD